MGARAPEGLHRSIGLVQASAMVVGTIIGASIFVQPSEITARTGSISVVFLAWAAAGLLTLFGALVCAELSSVFPRTGGVYVFLRECFSPAVGFLWAWAMFWTMHSGIIAAIGTVVARYAGIFIPLGPLGTKAVAITSILALSAVNYMGVRHGSALQTAFTLGKVLAVVLIVAMGFSLGGNLPDHFVGGTSGTAVTPAGFLLAVSAGLFAFGGWHMVTYAAEETVNPTRTIPLALLIGTVTVTVAYIAMNAVYLYVLPMDAVAKSSTVAADAARTLLGDGAARAVSALVLFSSFGALAGIVLSGPRVYLSMARDGLLFKWFGEVHPKYGTPHNAIVAQGVWSSILVATGTFRALFTRVVYTEWIFFGLLAVGLFVLRRRQGYAPPYRVWGFPIVPGAFALACLAIVINQVISDPKESALGLGMVLVGLPIYYIWLNRKEVRS